MQKPFVLVADDNEATCTLLTALLHHDFVVETAGDGASAIEKVKGRRYAAVILDLVMPRVDGFAVLDFLRDERPDLLARAIVVTAAIGRRDLDRLAGYAICATIRKPFDVEELLAKVRECAGAGGTGDGRGPMLSAGMLLLLADLLRERWM